MLKYFENVWFEYLVTKATELIAYSGVQLQDEHLALSRRRSRKSTHVITACKRSCGKVMFSQVFVCPTKGV